MREDSYSQAMFLCQERIRFLKQLNDKDFWDYAATCAYVMPDNQELSDAYLLCDLGSLGCVIPLADLRAVVPSPVSFSLLPDTPVWVLGLVAWSNTILAAVDLRSYLLQGKGMPASTHSPAMLLVAQHEDLIFGLLVPIISTMQSLDTTDWQLPEQIEASYNIACPEAIRAISVNMKDMMGIEGMDRMFLLDIPAMLSGIVKHM